VEGGERSPPFHQQLSGFYRAYLPALNIDDQPVTIKSIEQSIVDRAWSEGWIQPQIPQHRTGKYVAVIGSGPAGLACAQQLARAGHSVHLYEKQDRSGGLLRYGIPDFKLDKRVIDRRMAQMKSEGVKFHSGTHIGVDIPVSYLFETFDAIVLAGGSEQPRDLEVEGRQSPDVHFAMDFLRTNTRRVQGNVVEDSEFISAAAKNVVVIGGGDTGSDCIGTSIRHRAKSVTQIEILSQPPARENKALTWPNWPHKLRTSCSQEEGCDRIWDVRTRAFRTDKDGNLECLECVKVAWDRIDGQWKMREIEGSEFKIKAELALLAMGFVHPVYQGLLQNMGVECDSRGNVKAPEFGKNSYQTNLPNVFSAGDMRRGQSLVVWAIREGRQCAKAVDRYLQGRSELPD
jgi:glutamate synthase (NADPH/NADH) small chain